LTLLVTAARRAAPRLGAYNRTEEEPADMDLYGLKRGDRVRTTDGALVEVLNETEDGKWILVRYLEMREDASLVGTEDLCAESELESLVEAKPANK
jgi:hypothetical protein